ncbi:Uma2 family endonuclease [Desulfococcaceae bacterium HSG8]|nr:Uma2 family endonuclease [Desulfococcaceae bacterium HSG8]
MNIALKMPAPSFFADAHDRPGWIPPDIVRNWDTNPYAYQTEEELMPAGGLHGKILAYIMEVLRDFLEKQGLMLLMDTFLLYRDMNGIRQRISPDLLLMPFRAFPPSSYDTDNEHPPLAVVEVTSPKSHLKDLKQNVSFYAGLGVTAYLAVDAVTPRSRLRDQIGLYLWHDPGSGICLTRPDSKGCLVIPEMKVTVKARGQELIFADSVTGRRLHDAGQLRKMTAMAQKQAKLAQQQAKLAQQQTELAQQMAARDRLRAELLAEKLRSMGIDPDELTS